MVDEILTIAIVIGFIYLVIVRPMNKHWRKRHD